MSILGQAAIHIACMTLAVHWATEAMGPELLKVSSGSVMNYRSDVVVPIISLLFTGSYRVFPQSQAETAGRGQSLRRR